MLEIEYLGRVRELVGRERDLVALNGESRPIGTVLAELQGRQDDGLAALKMSWLRFACNDQFVDPDAAVRGGDRLAVFMAVAGG